MKSPKEKYYVRLSKKLLDTQTSSNSYWSMLKTLLNNKKVLYNPLFLHQDKFIINFEDKSEMLNNLFADQCSLQRNKSELPETLPKKPVNH